MPGMLVVAGSSILAIFLLLYLPQRNFVFSPSYYPNRSWFKEHADVLHLHSLPVTKSIALEYIIYEPAHPRQTIIYFGGKEQDSVGLVQKLSAQYPLDRWIACNYRGYGKSEGRPTERTVLADSLLLYDRIRKQYEDISLLGFSLGSSVASYVASKKDPKQVILVAPFDSVHSLIQTKAPFVPELFIRYKFPTIEFLPCISCPVYIYNSSDDEIVAPYHVRQLRRKISVRGGSEEFTGYTHDGLLFSPELEQKLQKLFAS